MYIYKDIIDNYIPEQLYYIIFIKMYILMSFEVYILVYVYIA